MGFETHPGYVLIYATAVVVSQPCCVCSTLETVEFADHGDRPPEDMVVLGANPKT